MISFLYFYNNQSICMETKYKACKNCEKEFDSSFEFCPYCGQKDKDDLTIGVLFYNTISNYFSFDARFFKSFIPLMIKPGVLAKRFIEGKRLLYLHPAQMYLFISVIFFFLLSVTVVRKQVEDADNSLKKTLETPIVSDSTKAKANEMLDSLQLENVIKPLQDKNIVTGLHEEDVKALDSLIKTGTEKSKQQISKGKELTFDFDQKKVDSLIAIDAPNEELYKAMGRSDNANFMTRKFYTQVLKFYKQRDLGHILQAIYDTIPISLFILLPIFALILKLLFFRRGQYAHHLVFSFYFFSFLFTVFSIILLVNYIHDISNWIDALVVMSTFVYLFLAIKQFYGQGWFVSFFKSGLATFVYLLFVIPIAIVIISLVGFYFY